MWARGLAATMLLVWACGSPGTTATIVPEGQVRGHILAGVERGDDVLTGLRIRDASGMIWTFTAEVEVELAASHARLHQVLGQTLLVSYLARGDRLLITEITD